MSIDRIEITSQEIVDSVKPWEDSVWSEVVTRIELVRKLSNEIIDAYKLSGEEITGFILKALCQRALEVINQARRKRVIAEEHQHQELKSLSTSDKFKMLIDEVARLFIGVKDAMPLLFAWTLRRVTQEYLECLYPQLKEQKNKLEKVKELLGFTELFRPAERPDDLDVIVQSQTFLGYPDYPPKFSVKNGDERRKEIVVERVEEERRTFGGALCRFIDAVACVLKACYQQRGLFAYFKLPVDLVYEYWKSTPTLQNLHCNVSLWWGHPRFLEICENNCTFEIYRTPWIFQGNIEVRTENDSQAITLTLPDFTRRVMPSVISGYAELLISKDEGDVKFLILCRY